MKISREGVLLIKSFEGFRPRATRREDGRWVVGYGHTASAREGSAVSESDAELLLQYDLIPVQAALSDGLTRLVNQHQYDALASFAFSVGTGAFRSSDVLSRVNAGAETDAADALVAWPEPPVRDAGLRRRAAERALFTAAPGSAVTLSDLLAAPVPAATATLPPPPVVVGDASQVAEIPASEPAVEAVPAEPDQPDPVAANDSVGPSPEVEPEIEMRAPAVGSTTESEPGQTTSLGSEASPASPIEIPIFAPVAAVADKVETAAVEADPDDAAMIETTLIETTAVESAPLETVLAETSTSPETLTVSDVATDAEVIAVAGPLAAWTDGFSPPHVDAEALQTARDAAYSPPRNGPINLVLPDVATDPFAHVPDSDASASADPFTGAVIPASPIIWPALDEVAAQGELQVSGDVAETAALTSPRLVWPNEGGGEDSVATRFDDQGRLDLSNDAAVWSDPFDAKAVGFSWRRVWAYLVMGGFGLVSLAMAMAALRKASIASTDVRSILAIAAVLAVIGAACVGVSAYNIYQRLSDDR